RSPPRSPRSGRRGSSTASTGSSRRPPSWARRRSLSSRGPRRPNGSPTSTTSPSSDPRRSSPSRPSRSPRGSFPERTSDMNRVPLVSRLALAALLALVCADARAVRRTEDPIALVPADAATVAVLHWNELKQTPLGERVLANFDHISADDDTARFFRETG